MNDKALDKGVHFGMGDILPGNMMTTPYSVACPHSEITRKGQPGGPTITLPYRVCLTSGKLSASRKVTHLFMGARHIFAYG